MRGVKRIHSIVIHKYSLQRLFAPKTAVSLTVFTWSGRRKKKKWKKAKIPHELETTERILSPQCTYAQLNLSSKKKKQICLF